MSVSVVACPSPVLQFFDDAGNPAVGGSILTQVGGVNAATYSDFGGTVPLPNPIPLNARGEVSNSAGATSQLFLAANTVYTFTLSDAAGNQIWVQSYVNGIQITGEATAAVLNTVIDIPILNSLDRTAAEITASVTPVNYSWPEGHVRRYGALGTGTYGSGPDDTTAFQAALNVAAASVYTGLGVYANEGSYRVTSALVFDANAGPIKFSCAKGATLVCDHNGNGLTVVSTNENFGGHLIEGWIINGPNTFLPAAGYVPPSTGAGVNMSRGSGDTSNAVTAYNSVLRDVTIQGFNYGLNLSCVIALQVFGGFIEYNQVGVYVDGGQTNANHFFGTHIRYNRKLGICSTGRTGGSLTNATANTFSHCLLESNIPYPFVSGGNPPTDSTAIYLSNSYDWVFVGCYSENHSASIYLTGASKGNKFIAHRLSGGTGRVDQVILDGASVNSNDFQLKQSSVASATEVSIVANNASQLYNRFSGEGVNFIAASIVAPLDYSDVRPSANYVPAFGVGLIRMPSQGFSPNSASGTNPGNINGMGTLTGTLFTAGYGEVQIGNGLSGDTTITTISGVLPHQFLMIVSAQATHALTITSNGLGGNVSLKGGNAILNAVGQALTLYMTGLGSLVEVGRNF